MITAWINYFLRTAKWWSLILTYSTHTLQLELFCKTELFTSNWDYLVTMKYNLQRNWELNFIFGFILKKDYLLERQRDKEILPIWFTPQKSITAEAGPGQS